MDNIFEKYYEFIKFEPSQIEERLFNLPYMVGFYQDVFYTLRQKHTKYLYQTEQEWTAKYLYYKTEFDIALNNAEIKAFIEKDLEYLTLKLKVQKITDLLDQVEVVLKGLDNMRWTIKSLIDWKRFQAGDFGN